MMKLDFNGKTYGCFGKYRYITCTENMEVKYVKNMETGQVFKFSVIDLLRDKMAFYEE